MRIGDRVELRGLEVVRHFPRTLKFRGKETTVWEYELVGPDHRLYYYSGVRLYAILPEKVDLMATVKRIWGNGHNVAIKRPVKLSPAIDQIQLPC